MNYLNPHDIPLLTEASRLSYETSRLKPINLIETLDPHDLNELRRYFFPKNVDYDEVIYNLGLCSEQSHGVPLSKEEFVNAVSNVIGNQEYAIAAEVLFDKLNDQKTINSNVIWWKQLLESIVTENEENEKLQKLNNQRKELQVKPIDNLITHCKSPIVKVLLAETPHSSCCVIISKFGKVGIYDENLEMKESYFVSMGKYKSITAVWITDAVYAPDSSAIIISSSNRLLFMYNTSQITHKLLFIVSGLPNLPTCLHYSSIELNKTSQLLVGDDRGNITTLTFKEPHKSFLKPKGQKQSAEYYWIELKDQKDWVMIRTEKKVHNDDVLQVENIIENNTVVSCSSDPSTSLVLRHNKGHRDPYIIKLEKGTVNEITFPILIRLWSVKGIRSFHLDKRLGLLATTSMDHVVKLWNHVNSDQPIIELKGHSNRVIDVAILRHANYIMSIDEDAVVKLWNLENHSCVETLNLNIPSKGTVKLYSYRALYPGIRSVSSTTEKEYALTQEKREATESQPPPKKNPWRRSEIIATYNNNLIIIQIKKMESLSVKVLPLPRKTLEPITPTPYYPLSHNFRENTKQLKQRMFKNLALLAPFYESSGSRLAANENKSYQDISTFRTFVRHGVPHMALKLYSIKSINIPEMNESVTKETKEEAVIEFIHSNINDSRNSDRSDR